MDAVVTLKDFVEELWDVNYKSKILATVLKLPECTVDAIHEGQCVTRHPFTNVVMQFIKHTPRPTWRIILDALRDPLISKPLLAESIEMNLHSTQPGNQISSN